MGIISEMLNNDTLYRQTELVGINKMLVGIGEMPLMEGTITKTLQFGSIAYTARTILREQLIIMCTRSWYFNTDYNFELVPDLGNFIALPHNVMKADFNPYEDNSYVMRGHQVYNMFDKTFRIERKIRADLTYAIDYEDLPTLAFNYLVAKASVEFEAQVIGSQEENSFLTRTMAGAWDELNRVNLEMEQFVLSNRQVVERRHNGYLRQTHIPRKQR